jgi:hypothetical protein
VPCAYAEQVALKIIIAKINLFKKWSASFVRITLDSIAITVPTVFPEQNQLAADAARFILTHLAPSSRGFSESGRNGHRRKRHVLF